MKNYIVSILTLAMILSCNKNPEEAKRKEVLTEVKKDNTQYYLKYYDNKNLINSELICTKNNIPIEKEMDIIKSYLTFKDANIETQKTLNDISKIYNIDKKDLSNFLYDYFIINKAEGLDAFIVTN